MIKLKIKDRNEKGIEVNYNVNNSHVVEHIAGIISLYRAIKEHTDYTDEEILRLVKAYKGDEVK